MVLILLETECGAAQAHLRAGVKDQLFHGETQMRMPAHQRKEHRRRSFRVGATAAVSALLAAALMQAILPNAADAASTDSVGYIYPFAGGGSSSCVNDVTVPAQSASVGLVLDSATDPQGNLFVNDYCGRVAKVTTDGVMSTWARPSQASQHFIIWSMAIDASGNVFFSDTNGTTLRKIDAVTKAVTVVAGAPDSSASSGDGGPATSARFNGLNAIRFDEQRANLYVVDGRYIRRINMASGVITRYAGNGDTLATGTGDGGPALNAGLDVPERMALDKQNNLYFTAQDTATIRKIDGTTHTITTIAGTTTQGYTGDGGPALTATICPGALTFDSAGNLVFSNCMPGSTLSAPIATVRSIDKTGKISTIAGNGQRGDTGDFGPATQAPLPEIDSLSADVFGNIFVGQDYEVSNQSHARIRRIATIGSGGTPSGEPQFTTLPAGAVLPGNGDGFQIAASDPTGQRVSLSWTTPPTSPTKVDCGSQPTTPALTAIIFCTVTKVASGSSTSSMVFTATNDSGRSTQATIAIGASPTASGSSVLVTKKIHPEFNDSETFSDQTFTINSPGGHAVLSSTADGSGGFTADNRVSLRVTRPDGTKRNVSLDSTNGCATPVTRGPADISRYLKPGTNTVRMILGDSCPNVSGEVTSPLWLTGDFAGDWTRVINVPSVKAVRYLQVNDLACIADLTANGFGRTASVAGCTFLRESSNTTPPKNLQGKAWAKFVDSKQFRGFINMPTMKIYCSSNNSPVRTDVTGTFGVSPGWTGDTKIFDKGEWDSQDPSLHPSQPDIQPDPTSGTVAVSAGEASRIATAARKGQFKTLGYDAPFIWQRMSLTASCVSGDVTLTQNVSAIPFTATYVDGIQVSGVPQSTDLAGFVKSGGTKLNKAGIGNLAPSSTWNPIIVPVFGDLP